MTQVDMSVRLTAPAEKVWALIGGFDALPRWHPAIAKSDAGSDGGRRTRRLTLRDGAVLVEALEAHDDAARRYAYTITEGPLPLRDYHSELAVEPDGADACRVRWSGRFEPDAGAEAQVTTIIRGVYQAGFDSLAETFGR